MIMIIMMVVGIAQYCIVFENDGMAGVAGMAVSRNCFFLYGNKTSATSAASGGAYGVGVLFFKTRPRCQRFVQP